MENAPESTKVIKAWEGTPFSDAVRKAIPCHEQKVFDASNPNHLDSKQRIRPEYLCERELLEEIVTTLRTTQDAMEGIVASASKNPMFKMLGIKGL